MKGGDNMQGMATNVPGSRAVGGPGRLAPEAHLRQRLFGLVLAVAVLVIAAVPAAQAAGLHRAVKAGDLDGVTRMLAAGTDVNARDKRGRTALMYAVDKGYLLLVEPLLAAKADPNLQAPDGATALFIAVVHEYSDIIERLLKAGADPTIKGPRGKTPGDFALKNVKAEWAPMLLKAALDAGMNVNLLDRAGWTPLMYAADRGDVRLVEALLAAKAYPNLRAPDGATALFMAAAHGHSEIIVQLMKAGADPALKGPKGKTATEVAQVRYGTPMAALKNEEDPAIIALLAGKTWAEGEAFVRTLSKWSSWPSAVAGLEQQMVTVSRNTQLSKYEVTQALWEAVMGTNPSHFQGCGQCPVERVSWDDIQVFLQKLNAMTGEAYRLPTEAEWAGALGSGGGAWHGENSGWRTHPVGQQSPNELGLYDMKGNVWEWMEDCWKGDCSRRVVRGGSWVVFPESLRSASRGGSVTGNRDYSGGFRLARTLTP